MRLILAGLGGALICAACSPSEPTADQSPPNDPAADAASLETPPPGAAPGVRIEADPPPPFAYWAPAGSVIRNHPTSPGVWFAEIDGRRGPIYFGDDCGAARLQGLVGRPDVPGERLSSAGGLRDYAVGQPVTSDLRADRLNVERNAPGGRILSISCG